MNLVDQQQHSQARLDLPGALTQLAFSLVPTPILSITFSGSSPPTSVTVIRLELLARPLDTGVCWRVAWLVEGLVRWTAEDEWDRMYVDRAGFIWELSIDGIMLAKSTATPSRIG